MRVLPLLFALLLPVSAADLVIGGPYAVRVGKKTATVAWVVEGPGTLRGASTEITGLKPGSSKPYEIAGIHASFKTPPVSGEFFRFVVYGDTRTRHNIHRQVIEDALKMSPDFAIHTGDMVANGSSRGQWREFFDIENPLLRTVAFFPVIGNHEHNTPYFDDFFHEPKTYYSFDWGSAHFTMLDTDFGHAGGEPFWREQAAWMESDLGKAASKDFRFVVTHHPPFSVITHRQGSQDLLRLVPIFEKYKVTAVFSGHDHNYQRHLKNGITYIVTGGGGAPLYAVDRFIPGVTQKAESTENFVTVDILGKHVGIEARALNGRLIDTIDLK